MSIYKRGGFYWYKFMFDGKLIRESTKQGNNKVALDMKADKRAQLVKEKAEREAARERLGCSQVLRCHECEKLFNADKAIKKGNNAFCGMACAGAWDKKHSMPTLAEFLNDRFLRHVNIAHAAKPRTRRYYVQGTAMLVKSAIAANRLDELTDEHAQAFISEHSKLSASGINRGLRTLRRALNLAHKWRKLEHPVKIVLAAGERQRDRVLTDVESERYLKACPQPWKDCATIILDEGFRPGEVFVLQWPHVFFENSRGFIKIVEGKSKAARRTLPMTPRVYQLLRARHESAGFPNEGWVFPSSSREGHFNGDGAKGQHKLALEQSHVEPFEPYVLRHTALTRIAETCNDPFVVMRIAGHSSITMTQRYIHPEADAIGRVFTKLAEISQFPVGTKVGTAKKQAKPRLLKAARQTA